MKDTGKKFVLSVEFLPNLILHVLAAAGVGYDPTYGRRFRDSLTLWEKSFFARLPKGAFHPRTGDLFLPFLVFPSYFSARNVEEARVVFQALIAAYERKGLVPLNKAFPQKTESLQVWWDNATGQIMGLDAPGVKDLKEFSKVVLSYGSRFYEEFWKEKKKEIEEVRSYLEAVFLKKDVIGAWEALTGQRFKFPCFNVVLCEANRRLDGVSLGYERDLFYFKRDRQELIDFVVHEVGTHLLKNLFFDDDETRAIFFQHPDVSYNVYEAGVEFLRGRISRKFGFKGKMKVVARLKAEREGMAFARIYRKCPNKDFKSVFLNTVKYLSNLYPLVKRTYASCDV